MKKLEIIGGIKFEDPFAPILSMRLNQVDSAIAAARLFDADDTSFLKREKIEAARAHYEAEKERTPHDPVIDKILQKIDTLETQIDQPETNDEPSFEEALAGFGDLMMGVADLIGQATGNPDIGKTILDFSANMALEDAELDESSANWLRWFQGVIRNPESQQLLIEAGMDPEIVKSMKFSIQCIEVSDAYEGMKLEEKKLGRIIRNAAILFEHVDAFRQVVPVMSTARGKTNLVVLLSYLAQNRFNANQVRNFNRIADLLDSEHYNPNKRTMPLIAVYFSAFHLAYRYSLLVTKFDSYMGLEMFLESLENPREEIFTMPITELEAAVERFK